MDTNNGVTLQEFIIVIKKGGHIVRQKLNFVLVFGLIGALLGFCYAKFKKINYSAVTTFVLQDSNEGGGGLSQYASVASAFGMDLGGGSGGIFQGDNILELYKSDNMLKKALLSGYKQGNKNMPFIDKYIDINNLRVGWKTTQLKSLTFNIDTNGILNRLQDSVIKSIIDRIRKKNLIVSRPDKKLNIYKVEVHSTDEFFSKEFNDQIAQTVNNFYVQTKTKKSLQNCLILQHQVDSVKSILNSSMVNAVSVVDATPNLNPTKQILRIGMQRSQINVEESKALLIQLVQNLEISKITLRKETPLLQVIDQPFYPLDKDTTNVYIATILGAFLASFIFSIIIIIKGYVKHLMM